MWNIFKVVNLIWLLSSTYMWLSTYLPLLPLLVLVNVAMIICMSFLPIRVEFNKSTGLILAAICGLVLWSTVTDGYVMGIFTFLSYLPVLSLIMLPVDYQKDLLRFVTKWYAIMLGIGLVEYFACFVISLPSIGNFDYTGYPTYINHFFYLETTIDESTVVRFNAFFLEPGHQALVSSFLMLANSYKFKENPYLYILLAGVIFSFSLAGYLLTSVAVALLFTKSMKRALLLISAFVAFVVVVLNWNGGDNTMYELIISRLEYDEEKGVKGNNRYYNDTDFIFQQAQKKGRTLTGVQEYVNMELVGGAGFKIYVIKYGWVGVILVALLYLSLIPKNRNLRYTVIFYLVLSLCFIQRAYPTWYSWLLPYVLGIYINRKQELPYLSDANALPE